DRGQDAGQGRAGGIAVAGDKIVWTEPDAARHGHKFAFLEIEPLDLVEGGMVVALQDVRGMAEGTESLVHGGGPIGLREVAAEENAAGAPGFVGEAGDLEDEISPRLRMK